MLLEIDDHVLFIVTSNIDDICEDLGLSEELVAKIAEGCNKDDAHYVDLTFQQLDAIKEYGRDPEIKIRGMKRVTKEMKETNPDMFEGAVIPEDAPTLKKGASDKEVMDFINAMMGQLEELKGRY